MKLISHRGNIVSPKPERENSPSYIDTAISVGYDVEVDIRFIDGKFYLGHDTPDYEVTETWLEKRKNILWLHCKNVEAASALLSMDKYTFFCHSDDSFVLTSNNYVWTHDLSINLDEKCVLPLLSENDILNFENGKVYGICTDYINLAESDFKIKNIL
jgi:hypothetical protein